jgi:DNA-binding NarL/FixJ family response regulator
LIRVSILSPNPLTRIGLRELLSSNSDLEIVNEGSDIKEIIGEKEAEVLIITSASAAYGLGELDGGQAVLLITEDPDAARRLLGARLKTWGVLTPSAAREELNSAVHALAEGLIVGSPQLMDSLIQTRSGMELTSGEDLPDPLTTRENEVLQLIALGLANKQIAARLSISEHTVKFHLTSLYAKLNVSSRTEAVRAGFGLGLISL